METSDVRSDDMLPDLPTLTDPDLTWITIILDRSGSMASARESTVAGFNEFVRDQKKLPGQARLKLVQFDDQYDEVFDLPLSEVPELTQDTFVPRGWTALYDAQGKTITTLQENISKLSSAERPSKVVIVTLTDGMDNKSKEYSKTSIASLNDKMKNEYKWQLVYLGANQDAVAVGGGMNYFTSQSLSYKMDRMGQAMNVASSSVSRLRSMSPISFSRLAPSEVEEVMAFTEEERKIAIGKPDDKDAVNPAVTSRSDNA